MAMQRVCGRPTLTPLAASTAHSATSNSGSMAKIAKSRMSAKTTHTHSAALEGRDEIDKLLLHLGSIPMDERIDAAAQLGR
jgi:hypothetical protein